MVSFPPCKINLGLHILSKRADGYHDLETCFYPVPWTDALEIIPAHQLTFTSSGNTIPGSPDDNLCLKAYALLQRDFALPPVHIHLHKVIPTGAGLGGGSSDGAYTLRMINEIFSVGLSTAQLMGYAAKLGSDCAFFIQNNPMVGTGRGEILQATTMSLKGKFIFLIKPPVHVSTAEAYAGVKPKSVGVNLRTILEQHPITRWKELLTNDFEESVFQNNPALKALKASLYAAGASYASMSGSGSSVFGIFEQPTALPIAADHLAWSGYVA